MLRKEVQNKTGLTRKAIEYYEEKGLINPQKLENGYRNYSDEDLEILNKITILRKVGMNVAEIEDYINSKQKHLSSFLRRKQQQLDIEEKRKEVLELIIKGENQDIIKEKIKLIETEETIYEKLEKAFPVYFGQMFFSTYQPFLNEPLDKENQEYYEKFVTYLDNLPPLKLSKEEQEYINSLSSSFDMQTLKEVNENKIKVIENIEEWIEENRNTISEYEDFKNSEEYKNSPMKDIQDKIQQFMTENKYYEIAIPLIRKFSKSYDTYYKKLLEANDKYININKY